MIRLVRTARIVPGKQQEAIQFVKELREYNKPKFEGGSLPKIYLEILGDSGVVCWMIDFENLATLESVMNAVWDDAGFQKRVKSVGELFMPDLVEKVYSSID